MNDTTTFATETLWMWYQRIELAADKSSTISVFEASDGIATVSIDSPEHAISVCARDKGSCLDIMILEKRTAELKCPASGPCRDQSEISRHLSLFLTWFLEAQRAVA